MFRHNNHHARASRRASPLLAKEFVRLDAGLLEDCPQRALGRIAGMIHQRCVAFGRNVEPDFMRAGGLPIEGEAERLQPLRDFAIAETGKSSNAGQPSTSG